MTELNNIEILQKTLNQMAECFTGQEFTSQARINKLTDRFIKNGITTEFLKRNCRHQGYRSKVWYKTSQENKTDQIQFPEVDQEKEAIEYLKKLGYKILKPVSEFKEV